MLPEVHFYYRIFVSITVFLFQLQYFFKLNKLWRYFMQPCFYEIFSKMKIFFGYDSNNFKKKKCKVKKNKTFDEKNVQIFAEMQLSANLFPLESSIQKHSGSRGAVPVVDAGGAKPPAHKKINSTNFPQKKFLEIFFFLT